MHLNVHSRVKGEKINKSVLEAGEKLFRKLSDMLPEAAMIDIDLENLPRHKKGRTHYVHVTVMIPGESRTFHAEATEVDFRCGLDKVFSRTQKYVRRWHGTSKKLARRLDRKAKVKTRTWLHVKLSKPHKFFGKFRKHDPEIPVE